MLSTCRPRDLKLYWRLGGWRNSLTRLSSEDKVVDVVGDLLWEEQRDGVELGLLDHSCQVALHAGLSDGVAVTMSFTPCFEEENVELAEIFVCALHISLVDTLAANIWAQDVPIGNVVCHHVKVVDRNNPFLSRLVIPVLLGPRLTNCNAVRDVVAHALLVVHQLYDPVQLL